MVPSSSGDDTAGGRLYTGEQSTSTSMALIAAVAEYKGVRRTELPPLGYEVDLEAVDDLFDGTRSSSRRLAISYAGVRVTVSDDGTIRVADLED